MLFSFRFIKHTFLLVFIFTHIYTPLNCALEEDFAEKILQKRQKAREVEEVSKSLLDESREKHEEKKIEFSEKKKRFSPSDVLTNLESLYSVRAGVDLTLFGYDQLMIGASLPELSGFYGRVGDDYILGIGDELVVSFRGQNNRSFRTKIDREGKIVLPELPPLLAAGITFGEFVKILEQQTKESFLNTEVFASLGALKQIKIMVLGEVSSPGQHVVTNLSSVLDALQIAGGIKKNGSLRSIKLIRNGNTQTIDLYDIFISEKMPSDIFLKEGDRIVVPNIGYTVAIAQDVHRPGIYELPGKTREISLNSLLTLAGSSLRTKGNRFLILNRDKRGLDHTREFRISENVMIQEGDLVSVLPQEDKIIGNVRLVGKVNVPGVRSLSQTPTMSALLRDKNIFGSNPYTLFGVIYRVNPENLVKEFQAVNFEEVINKKKDYPLCNEDVVIVLSLKDIDYLISTDVQTILAGKKLTIRSKEKGITAISETEELKLTAKGHSKDKEVVKKCIALQELEHVVQGSRIVRFSTAIQKIFEDRNVDVEEEVLKPCRKIYEEYPKLLPFVLDHVVAINGEIRHPGLYPILNNTPLRSVVAVAGSPSREANLDQIELSRLDLKRIKGQANIERINLSLNDGQIHLLLSGDLIRIHPYLSNQETGPVLVEGEVKRPGWYDIKRGEKLSEILVRAGGFTQEAYPYGAIFTRERVKFNEKDAIKKQIDQLENNIATVSLRNLHKESGTAGEILKNILHDLKNVEPQGRVVLEADYPILQLKPELDTILEPYDKLYIPKRPNYVTVSGEVLNPSTLQFKPGLRPIDYIKMAGGFQRYADSRRAFMILPNGQSIPLRTGAWNYTPETIPPGSAIIVPRDLESLSILELARDITPILSNLTMTAASIAVISRGSR